MITIPSAAKSFRRVALLLTVLTLSFSFRARAQTCITTTPIGSAGDLGTAVAIQFDGKIVLAGYSQIGAQDDFALVRYNPDFSLDLSFGTNGIVTTDFFGGQDRAEAIALQLDGKIVVAGHATNATRDFAIARYNVDGSLDGTFGAGGKATSDITGNNDEIEGVAVDASGRIVVAGFAQNATLDYVVARYSAAGALDTAGFASPNGYFVSTNGVTSDVATAVAIQPADGKIVIGGWAHNGANEDFSAARFNPDGTIDGTFGGGTVLVPVGTSIDQAFAMTLQSDGKVLLAGWVRVGSWTLFGLARLNTDGSLDTATFNPLGTFGDAPNVAGRVTTDFTAVHDSAFGVVQQPDNKIVLAGYTNWDGASTNVDFALARYNADGSLDGGFGTAGKVTTPVGPGNDWIDSLALQGDGKLVTGGYSSNGSDDDFALARYNPDGTLDTSCSADCTPLFTTEGAGEITVTSSGSFEMTFSTLAGGAIREFFDLGEDPGASTDLAAGLNPPGLHNIGLRIAPNNYNASNDDTGPKLTLLEATPTRVRVRQESFYEDDSGNPLAGIKGVGDYSVYASGKTALHWNRSTTLDIVNVDTEYLELVVHYTDAVPPLDSWAGFSETDGVPSNPPTDRFVLAQNEVAGARTDFLNILYENWARADSVSWNTSVSGERINFFWIDVPGVPFNIGAGSSEDWNFLTYFKPTSFVDNTDVAVTSRTDDYRTPDALSIMVGTAWNDPDENTGSDHFNESEGAYLLTFDPILGLRFDLDGGTIPRYEPFFKIRHWRSLADPAVTLEGVTLANDVQFKADVKPISDADFADRILFHTTLENFGFVTGADIGDGTGATQSGITYAGARYGAGAEFDALGTGDHISIPLVVGGRQNLELSRGRVEFWFKPNWNHDDNVQHYLLDVEGDGAAGGSRIRIKKESDVSSPGKPNWLNVWIDDASGVYQGIEIPVTNYRWQAGEWIHLGLEWDSADTTEAIKLFLNGVRLVPQFERNNSWTTGPETASGFLRLGNHALTAGFVANGIFDELTVYSALDPTPLAHGGLASNSDEYLGSASRNLALPFAAVDPEGRGEYFFLGSDSKFRGLNVVLTSPGVGTSPVLAWEYWNGTAWTPLTLAADETNSFTNARGTIYWNGDPFNWTPYSVNAGPDLYYVRTHLSSGDYATQAPVESVIKTDILLLQYCGDVTLDAQTFELAVPVATAVELASFRAEAGDREVTLRWRTASEMNNLGFHLYRAVSPHGPFERITATPIPGLGSSPEGAHYSYLDLGLLNDVTYFYTLEDIDTSGRTERHGVVSAVPTALGGGSGPTEPTEPADEEEETGPPRIVYGRPEENSLQVLSRTSTELIVELRTEGFYAAPRDDGTVTIDVPGMEALDFELLPVRRSWVEVSSERGVRLASVHPGSLVRFSSLHPGAQETQVVASRKGVVELVSVPSRARARRAAGPWARLLDTGYQGDVKKAFLEFLPLQWDDAREELVLSRRLRVRLVFAGREPTTSAGTRGARVTRGTRGGRSLIAQLVTRSPGIYALRYADLPGRRGTLDGTELRLSHLGRDVPFRLHPREDRFGPGSTLYFVSRELEQNPYDRETVYELSRGEAGTRMETADGRPVGPSLDYHWKRIVREEERYYQPTLLAPPHAFAWDFLFAPTVAAYDFELSALVSGAPDATLQVELVGVTDTPAAPDHHVVLSVNGNLAGEHHFDGRSRSTVRLEIPTHWLNDGLNRLTIENPGDTAAPYSVILLDRFEIVYPRRAVAEGGSFQGMWDASGMARVSQVGSAPIVFDVPIGVDDDISGLRWVSGVETDELGALRFHAEAGRTYWIGEEEMIPAPEVRPPHRPTLADGGGQYIVVGPRSFLEAAAPLLAHREQQGLHVRAAAIEHIYDEFSYGEARPEAIRAFLRHAYHVYRPRPEYVLLLGDGSYDYQDVLGTGVQNHVPPLLVETSYLWTASDPTLAAVNGDDFLPDLAIGRLPAASVSEARAMVNKILAWELSGDGIEGRVVLVADRPDPAGDFVRNADALAVGVLKSRQPEKIYLNELGPEEAARSVRSAFDSGVSLMSYLGHGGIHLWSADNLLDTDAVAGLATQPRQPLLLTMNCLNGYFHFPHGNSLSEELLKAEEKGVVAAFSPSGLSLDGPAHELHRALLAEIVSGEHSRLGDAVRAAQSTYATHGVYAELLLIYHLFGDPGLKID